MRPVLKVVACVVLGLLVACASLTPSEHAHAVAALGEMLRTGAISQAQYEALVAALSGSWWESLTNLLLPIAGAWLGVPMITNLARGKVTARKGLAEALAKVRPTDSTATS